MKNLFSVCLVMLFAGVVVVGCSQEEQTSTTASTVVIDGSKYLLDSEPEGVKGVREVREAAKDQDDVVVVGRIGGSENPWVDGIAAFSIVDPVMKHCGELGDDGCPKPWDFC